MLLLRGEIGGNEIGIGCFVGNDHELRRSGGHVDADGADQARLGRGDVAVARPDDFVDARERLRAECRRRHAGCATAAINLADAEPVADEVELIAIGGRRRRDRHDLAHARDARRNGGHNQRGEVHRPPTRHVKSDAPQWLDAMDNLRPVFAPRVSGRQLLPMKCIDALNCKLDRFLHSRIDADPAWRDENVVDRDAVESRDLFANVCVAARPHARDGGIGDTKRFRFHRINFVRWHLYLPSS